MSFMIVDPYSYGIASEPAAAEYLGSVFQNPNSPVTIPFGTEKTGRYILVVIHGGTLVLPTSGTISGVPVDMIFTHIEPAGNVRSNHSITVLGASIPFGSSGSMILNYPSNPGSTTRIQTYSVTGLDSIVPISSAHYANASTVSGTVNVQVERNGLVFGIASIFSLVNTDFTSGLPPKEYYEMFAQDYYAVGSHETSPDDEAARSITYARTSGRAAISLLLIALSFK